MIRVRDVLNVLLQPVIKCLANRASRWKKSLWVLNKLYLAPRALFKSTFIASIAFFFMPVTSFTGGNVAGDLAPRGNPDGVLNTADVLLLQRIVSGQITPTAEELVASDVAPLGNPDGLLNAGDIVVLQRAVLGTVSLPPLNDTLSPPQADVTLISVSDSGSGLIQITGDAGSVEGDATVSLVNYATGASSSVVANANGSFTSSLNARAGEVFSVVVSDAAGNTSPSASVGVGQILTLNVSSPADGITVNEDSIYVAGSYNGPPGTAITVNGRTACTDGSSFYANNISLEPGVNSLIITATMSDGLSITQTQTITSLAVTPVTVQADAPCGFAPHTVEFVLINTTSNTILQIDADYDGDGTTDLSTNDPAAVLSYTYTATGVYQAAFTIDDQSGMQHNLTQTIVVSDLAVIDAQLRNVYNNMLDRLRVGAIDGALNRLTPVMQDNFRPVFQALGSNLTTVVDQLGTIAGGQITEALAFYTVVRDENGTQMGYPVYLIRGVDGIWRIGQM